MIKSSIVDWRERRYSTITLFVSRSSSTRLTISLLQIRCLIAAVWISTFSSINDTNKQRIHIRARIWAFPRLNLQISNSYINHANCHLKYIQLLYCIWNFSSYYLNFELFTKEEVLLAQLEAKCGDNPLLIGIILENDPTILDKLRIIVASCVFHQDIFTLLHKSDEMLIFIYVHRNFKNEEKLF